MSLYGEHSLFDVPFETLKIGDRLIGANNICAFHGKIISLDPETYFSGGEYHTGWLEIHWDNSNVSIIPQDDGGQITYIGK